MQDGDYMFDDTVTIFNYYNGKYYPTVICGVELQAVKVTKNGTAVISSEDTVNLHIKMDNLKKAYIKPKEWNGESNKFTLNSREKKDFFVLGEFEETIIDDDSDEYINGFYEHMRIHYDDVYLINSVAEYKTIPHLEVGGK